MKNLLLTLLACVFFISLRAQAPNWLWANSIGGTGVEQSFGIGTDGNGNTYAVGYFSSPTITIGNITLTNAGGYDGLLVKYGPSGNVIWAQRFGGTGDDYGRRVDADAQGNCFITGHFGSPTLTFGNTTLTNLGFDDVFAVKFDSAGNVLWARSGGGTSMDYAWGLGLDSAGNCYIAGFFNGNIISFNNITINSPAVTSFFLVKYSSTGTVQWAKTSTGSGMSACQGIAVDAVGNCFITGAIYASPVTFGNITLTPGAGGDDDFFIAKYNAAGNCVWAKSAAGPGDDEGRHVAVDDSGNCYATGWYTDSSINFGNAIMASAGGQDAFLVKYDSSGNVLWSKRAGGLLNDFGYSLGVDAAGNSYLAGTFSSSSISFGSTSLANSGIHDIFVVKHDPSGNVSWMKQTGGTGGQSGTAIAVDGAGDCYLSGIFYGSSPLTLGNTSLNNAGGDDVFVARIASCTSAPAQPPFVAGDATPCSGSSQTYSVLPVPGATSYIWTLPSGWTGTTTSNGITATPGTTTGTITVAASNSCGTSPPTSFTVTAVPLPPAPAISNTGTVLTVTATFASYQWYLNGSPVTGATSQSHTATQNGAYHVVVTNADSCTGTSNTINIIISAIDELEIRNSFAVYPNPATDVLNITNISGSANNAMIQVYDGAGKPVRTQPFSGKSATITIAGLPAGLYTVRVGTERAIVIKR